MCYGNPTESLKLACERLTRDQRRKFEEDFAHFRAYSGLDVDDEGDDRLYEWAKWAYLCGKGL